MTSKTLETSGRAGWLAGAMAGATLALTAVFVNFSPEAQSADAALAPGTSFADIIENVSPAVVNIAVTKVMRSMPTSGAPGPGPRPEYGPRTPFDEFFGRFFEMPGQPAPERRAEGQGSGFVIDAEGLIVTNNHVIESAEAIVVTLQDGRKLDATLVGTDPKTDLALLKVAQSGLPYVEFGDSGAARVGDWVIAIGNPFGLGGTATAGIISARGRDIQSGPYDDYLQIDAPINSGNSGGPVFDAGGKVIGVNTAIFSPNGGNIGIGFAIPADQAKAVVAQLKENGTVQRGWLGVQIQGLDAELAATLGLQDERGALVAEVTSDSPAERGGVLAGDVIRKFNDQEIDSARALSRAVAEADPDDTAVVTVWRDGRSKDLRVKLGAAAADQQAAAAPARSGADASDALGLSLRGLTDQDKAQLGLPGDVSGALVVSVQPDSAAAEKGLRPGDVITQVNRNDTTSVDDVVAALTEARKDDRALLLVRRGDGQRFVALNFS